MQGRPLTMTWVQTYIKVVTNHDASGRLLYPCSVMLQLTGMTTSSSFAYNVPSFNS